MNVLRLFGALLIISACGAYGAGAVARLAARVRTLEGLIASLGVLSGEICSRLMPMRDALEAAAEGTDGSVRAFYQNVLTGMESLGERPFSEIWRGAVSRTLVPELGEERCRTLADLGSSLGRYDVDEQAGSIALAQKRLTALLARAEEERRRDGRVHAFFSLAAGLFAVIILL